MTEERPPSAVRPSQSLTIIIPSRTQLRQADFLRQAVLSIKSQTVYSTMMITILVGIDHGESLPLGLADELALLVVASHAKSQAAALNAGLRTVGTDLVAILEDDDRWHPLFLELALKALSIGAGFVSSTQLEINENANVLRINDFPTPSGWLMPASTMRAVGEFNESYRWHLDSEWLGRLAEKRIQRLHLVEATAPVDYGLMAGIRPWLANVIRLGGPASRIVRHDLPIPLIRRLVHSQSGMSKLQQNSEAKRQSQQERDSLDARFGRIPW